MLKCCSHSAVHAHAISLVLWCSVLKSFLEMLEVHSWIFCSNFSRERERERERDSACVWVLYIYIQTHFFPNNPRDGNLILSDPEVEGVTCWEKYYDYKELSISCNIYYRSNYKRLLPWIYILCTMNISTILQQWINIAFFKIINLKWFFMYLHVSKCL